MTLLEAIQLFTTAVVNRNNQEDINAAVQTLHDILNPPAKPLQEPKP